MKSLLLLCGLVSLTKCQDIIQQVKQKFGESEEVLNYISDLSDKNLLVLWWDQVNNPKPGLLVIDLQNDFINGSLAVTEAEDILELNQEIIDSGLFERIAFSKDWHPSDHISFFSNLGIRELDPEWRKNNTGEIEMFDEVVFARDPPYSQVLWPDHCIQDSQGAEIHSSIHYPFLAIEILKGTDPEIDSYSAFFDNGGSGDTGLQQLLEGFVTEVVVIGLATDYCVGSTTLDAQKIGLPATLLTDASRGVDPGTTKTMLDRVRAAGGQVSTWTEWQESLDTWTRAKHLADTLINSHQSSSSNQIIDYSFDKNVYLIFAYVCYLLSK